MSKSKSKGCRTLHSIAHMANRSLNDSARRLFASALFPLTPISFMLTRWRSGGLEDTSLSDSDCEDDEGDNGNGELAGGYTTHTAYEAYVPLPIHCIVPVLRTSVLGVLRRSSDTTHR